MPRIVIVVFGLSLVVLMGGCTTQPVQSDRETRQEYSNPITEQVPMKVGKVDLMVEVRDSAEERSLGLSYRESLAESEGMLFVFEEPREYGFWMKGMNFPLDMIWIRDGEIVEISADVPVYSEAGITRVTPSQPVDMVLEVSGGWAERSGVLVGDRVELSNG